MIKRIIIIPILLLITLNGNSQFIYFNNTYANNNLGIAALSIEKDGNNLSLAKRVKIQTILVEAMDILRRPVDLALFLDKIYFDIKKVVKSLN